MLRETQGMFFITLAFMAPFFVLAPVTADQILLQQNLIKNGDFEQGMAYWDRGVISPRGTDYPIIQVASQGANHYLLMDVPEPSAGYVEQKQIRIPQGAHALLSMKTWGATQPVEVRVLVIESTGRTDEIDSYDPEGKVQIGGLPTHHTYNLTVYSGRTITLRLAVAGLTSTGSIAMFDNIVLAASYEDRSIITLEVSDRGVFGHQTGFAPLGQLVTVVGLIVPSPAMAVPVYVNFTGPRENIITRITMTDSEGRYSTTINFTISGIWTVRSYWYGDAKHVGALSAPREFAVAEPMEVQLTSCTIRGLAIDNLTDPGFEVRPGENITASFTISDGDTWILTNVFVVMLDSWEPNKWTVISFQWGWNTEPLYYKQVYVAPDNFFTSVQRNPLTGRYETNATVNLPLTGDYYTDIYTTVNKTSGETEAHALRGNIPSFTTPMKEGTYYIGFLMSEVNSAQDLVNEQKVWTRPLDYFEKLVSSKRTTGYIQFVRVVVIDVDHYMRSAKDTIVRATNASLDVASAQTLYAEAQSDYASGHYLKAKGEAFTAQKLADMKLQELGGQIRSRSFYDGFMFLLANFVVSNAENRRLASLDFSSMNEYLTIGDYGRARIFELDLQRIAISSIGFYIVYCLMLWFAIGDIGSHLLGTYGYDPVEQLQKIVHRGLRNRLQKYHTALSAFLIFFPAQLLQEIIGSGFPPIGSLVLAGAVVGGWRYPIFRLHVRLKSSRHRRKGKEAD